MKKIFSLFVLALILLPSVLAITGEIGNARSILNREWNGKETVERTILVINSNDEVLDIKLEVSEGLEDIVELIDAEFELQPEEEKKAKFNLEIKKEGKWNGKIFVYFQSRETGNRVVLSSNIFLSVGEADEVDEIPEDLSDDKDGDLDDEEDDVDDEEEEEDDDADNGLVGFAVKGSKDRDVNVGSVVLIVVIALIVVAASVGMYFLFKKR